MRLLARISGLLLAAFPGIAASGPLQPAPIVFYVAANDPHAHDDNAGTSLGKPLKTLPRALERIAEFKAGLPGGILTRSVEVQIRAGEYALAAPLVLTAAHSGDAARSVTFSAYRSPGGAPEGVLISGGRHLNDMGSPWQEVPPGSGVWQKDGLNPGLADLPPPEDDLSGDPHRKWEFRDLYFGNARLTRARFPNAAWLNITGSGCTGDCPSPPDPRADFPCGRWFGVDQAFPSPWPGTSYEHRRVEVVARHEFSHPRQIVGSVGGPGNTRFYMAPQWPLGLIDCDYAVRHPQDPTECQRAKHPFDPDGGDSDWPCNLAQKPGFALGCDPSTSAHDCPVSPFSACSQSQVYLENSRSFLDANWEWFFDSFTPPKADGRLTVKLPPGVRPDDFDMVAPVLDRLVILRGEVSNQQKPGFIYSPVRNIHFRDLDFAFTHHPIQPTLNDPILTDGGPTADQPYYNDRGYAASQSGLRVNWHNVQTPRVNFMPGAIQLYAADGCSIRSCRIAHTGAGGIQACGSGNTIDGNEIFDLGAGGIHLGPFGYLYKPVLPFKITSGNVITNNSIHGFGLTYQDVAGYLELYVDGTLLAHNEIACGGQSGVSSGWNWNCKGPDSDFWGNPPGAQGWGTRIHYNAIHDVMRTSADGGAIYVPGNHTNAQQEADCDSCLWDENARDASVFGSMIGNWIYGVHKDPNYITGGRACGIYLEQGSRGWHVAGNVVEDVDAVLHINIFNNGAPTHWKFHSWARSLRPAFPDGFYENQGAIPLSAYEANYFSNDDDPETDEELTGSVGFDGTRFYSPCLQKWLVYWPDPEACGPPFEAQYPFDMSVPASGTLARWFQTYPLSGPPSDVNAIITYAGPRAAYQGFLYGTSDPLVHAQSPAPEACK